MKNMKKFLLFILLLSFSFTGAYSEQKIKNVIFLIGDGMGLNQVYAAMSKSDNKLNIERCQSIGFSKTYSADNYTTDSAAGGTALSSGTKTNNGVIGMNSDSVAIPSILQIAKQNKLSTGIVVTSSVTHATPASFLAHQINRKMEEEIALDILASDADVFIGGGKDFFTKRKDGKDLTKELAQKGYGIYYTLESASNSKSKKIAGLFAPNGMPSIKEGRGNMLPQSTQLALNTLSQNKKGFFLMVEGSQIDWGGHANDIDYIVNETLDFDKAVGVAMDFADKHKGTLVIVTADHETGGLSIMNGNKAKKEIQTAFTTTNHSSVPVPIYTYGTGAKKFSTFLENTDIEKILIELYKFRQK